MKASQELRVEVESAVVEEVERVGIGSFSKDAVVKRFLDRGVGRSTLYRWVDGILATGKPEEMAAKAVVVAAAERAARTADPAKEVAREVSAKLPTVPRIADIVTVGAVPIVERLNDCLRAADQLMAYARKDDGSVRNARLLGQASEHLRRCIDTASRITDTLMRAEKIQRYHSAIIDEIAAESPELAERILTRISRLSASWGNA